MGREIDFAETIGGATDEVVFTQHWNGTTDDQSTEKVLNGIDITQFHVYAVEMENQQLKCTSMAS